LKIGKVEGTPVKKKGGTTSNRETQSLTKKSLCRGERAGRGTFLLKVKGKGKKRKTKRRITPRRKGEERNSRKMSSSTEKKAREKREDP